MPLSLRTTQSIAVDMTAPTLSSLPTLLRLNGDRRFQVAGEIWEFHLRPIPNDILKLNYWVVLFQCFTVQSLKYDCMSLFRCHGNLLLCLHFLFCIVTSWLKCKQFSDYVLHLIIQLVIYWQHHQIILEVNTMHCCTAYLWCFTLLWDIYSPEPPLVSMVAHTYTQAHNCCALFSASLFSAII